MRQRRHSRSVTAATAAPVRPLALLLLALVLALAAWSAVGPRPAFATIYDLDASPTKQVVYTSSGPDYAGDVLVRSGIVYVAGSSYDMDAMRPSMLMVPFAAAPPSRTTYTAIEGYQDEMAPGRSGSIYTVGRVKRTDGSLRISVLKWAKTGSVAWARRFNRSGTGSDEGVDVGVDRAGNVVIAGKVFGDAGYDWVVASWSPSGVRRWVWRYGGGGSTDDVPGELYVDPAGNTYVTGEVTLSGGVRAAFTVKLSPAGKKLWTRTYKGPDGAGADANAIARRAAGGIWVGGTVRRGTGAWDALLVRYSPTGKLTASTPIHWGGPTSSTALKDITETSRDRVVGVGSVSDGGLPDPFECVWAGSSPSWASVPWTSYFDDGLLAVAADPIGGYCVTGQRAKGEDWRAVETYRRSLTAGGMYWTYTWDGPSDRSAHRPVGIVTTATAEVVAGTCRSDATGDDFFVQIWSY